jgi:predicted thioesterase
MTEEIKVGLTHQTEKTVAFEDTAAALGSGFVEVLATPMMIAVMEGTCAACVKPYLPETLSTVGTHVNVSHRAAVDIGETYFTECELIAIDRKKLTFKVRAFTQDKTIGEGTHDRFIIDVSKFLNK